jgi:hypothetical protein
MPATDPDGPFDSIESAHEFVKILHATAIEAMADLQRDRDAALAEGADRRAQAIELAIFKVKQLSCYTFKSRRMLNDLRTIRRLILNERLSVESIIATM